ncbi:CO/xanthine dehydrogenase Mo-binding subunit [Nakamurella sp. UYEF19]
MFALESAVDELAAAAGIDPVELRIRNEPEIDPASGEPFSSRHYGDFGNHDLAEYHVAVNADVTEIEAHWLDEFDDDLTPMGGKGIGEIGIVGAAAAVANAVAHATGHRVRSLPITPAKLLGAVAGF